MKKRLISLFVALTMLLCLIPAAFAATFNAGTDTASAGAAPRPRQRHERRGDG